MHTLKIILSVLCPLTFLACRQTAVIPNNTKYKNSEVDVGDLTSSDIIVNYDHDSKVFLSVNIKGVVSGNKTRSTLEETAPLINQFGKNKCVCVIVNNISMNDFTIAEVVNEISEYFFKYGAYRVIIYQSRGTNTIIFFDQVIN